MLSKGVCSKSQYTLYSLPTLVCSVSVEGADVTAVSGLGGWAGNDVDNCRGWGRQLP